MSDNRIVLEEWPQSAARNRDRLVAEARVLRAAAIDAFIRGIGRGCVRLVSTLATWTRRMRERAALASLDHRSLRDIGLTPLDALREARKPFWRG